MGNRHLQPQGPGKISDAVVACLSVVKDLSGTGHAWICTHRRVYVQIENESDAYIEELEFHPDITVFWRLLKGFPESSDWSTVSNSHSTGFLFLRSLFFEAYFNFSFFIIKIAIVHIYSG